MLGIVETKWADSRRQATVLTRLKVVEGSLLRLQWSEPTNEAIQGLRRCSRSSQELDLQDLNIECVWLLVYSILLNQIQYLQLWSSIT
nr:hypothetical protein CFP56_04960 [Quercus suber]